MALAQAQLVALQAALDEKSAALLRSEAELEALRASCSESAAQSQIHALENSVKNLGLTLQAQREGVEGALGFAPAGRGSAVSQKEKKYEETIQDLQFQLLYGETSKDMQLAKLNEIIIAQTNQHAHERFELAKLKEERERIKEQKVESWLLAEPFMAVM